MPEVITGRFSFTLADDKRTVRVEIMRDGQSQWHDLTAEEVDLFQDTLREMREAMIVDQP